MAKPVAFILKGYPRLSETFIAQEILGLERRGLDIRIVSLRHPDDPATHPIHNEIAAPVLYLPEYLRREPARVVAAWAACRSLPGYRAWRKDLARDYTRNRVRRFGQALVLAHEIGDRVSHLHAHFLHTPASVARYAALLLGLKWSCSAHAVDIWTSDEWEKREKLDSVDWLTTCTAFGAEHLRSLAMDAEKIVLTYHGLDLMRFPPPVSERPSRDGADEGDPIRLLSIGRKVPKKGLDTLLKALAQLPKDIQWRLTHIGTGALADKLTRQAEELDVSGRVEWRGAQSQETVLAAYRSADLFVLPCRVAENGDRDGLPNVLMEAQSQGLVCVSTRISGIPELIEDGETGVLVPPDDTAALASALTRLIRDPAARKKLGAAGQKRVHEEFDSNRGLDDLMARFSEGAGDSA